MPAKQVVEAGAKEGLVFSENLVYTVRAASKTPKSKPRAADAPAPKVAAPKASSVEQQLRKAIADVGLVRARAIFADVEAAFAGA